MNNASVQQRRTAASGRPLLTLPPAAKLLVPPPPGGQRAPRFGLAQGSPQPFHVQGEHSRSLLNKAKRWLFLLRKSVSRTGPLLYPRLWAGMS